MSQQNLNLRRSIYVARRHKKLFSGVAALGLLFGIAYALLSLPATSSVALVVVSGNPASLSSQAGSTDTSVTSLATQVVIAGSAPVLAAALPHVSPPGESLEALDRRISVATVGGSDILSITATGANAEQAENTANAVANSYVAYVSTSASVAVQAQARVLEPATTATGSKLPVHVAIYAFLGVIVGAIIALVICLALDRGDRRLVQRGDIANSIGVPVLLSIPVERPSDPASWATLLNEYEPDAVHAYGLRKLLQQMGVGGGGRGPNPVSLTILSLTSDPTALALGPQLAAFASAHGLPTALVLGPQQDMNVAATLHTVCAAGVQATSERRRPLRLIIAEDDQVALTAQPGAALTVVVMVIDGRDPMVVPRIQTSATLLGVSAGGATAAELARAATAATDGDRDIYGILVANPDPADQTTGRIPRLTSVQRALPTRVNGLTTGSML